MNLLIMVCVSTVLIGTCPMKPTRAYPHVSVGLHVKDRGQNKVGMLVPMRRTRSLSAVKIAMRAFNQLLKGAPEVLKTDTSFRGFVKTGGSKQAVKDFDELNLPNVEEITLKNGIHVKRAEVGDRVFAYSDSDSEGFPAVGVVQVDKSSGRVESFIKVYYWD